MAGETNYESVIGLEIHAHINTRTKLFCSCSTDSFSKKPNTNVCPICMGFPGQLPVLNKEAVKKGILAALALHCSIPSHAKFDRKNYFYPDLPKGYQISQYDQPISVNGWVDIETDESEKRIRINRLHLEDDAGKLTHTAGGTLLDFNRCGTPLMEIVTEPDLKSPLEAVAFAKTLQTIFRYVGVSEADMEKGMMRFDASISIRKKGEKKLNNRAEIKNLNSFKALEAALQYEIQRQIDLDKAGTPLRRMQTVGWLEEEGKTKLLREKETAEDYRYFPEPDLPPLVTERETVEALKKELPELPGEKKKHYEKEYGLSMKDAAIIAEDRDLAAYFETVVEKTKNPQGAASWITTFLLKHLKKESHGVLEARVTPDMLSALMTAIQRKEITQNMAKEVFDEMYETGKSPESIIGKRGLQVVRDENVIENICREVIEKEKEAVIEYRAGKTGIFGFLVGQVMKKTKGQALPDAVNECLRKLLK